MVKFSKKVCEPTAKMSYQFGGLSALISKKEPDPETTSKLVVKEFKLKTINEAKQQRQIAQEKVQTQSKYNFN